MAYTIMHRDGSMEADPPLASLEVLLDELDVVDPEHPDVAVSHESGWTLSAFPSGRLLFENVEDPELTPRQLVVDRSVVGDLFRALAAGNLERLGQSIGSRTPQLTLPHAERGSG